MLFKNFAVRHVMRAGTWASHTMFISFYLREFAHQAIDAFSIGPVVDAQQVM